MCERAWRHPPWLLLYRFCSPNQRNYSIRNWFGTANANCKFSNIDKTKFGIFCSGLFSWRPLAEFCAVTPNFHLQRIYVPLPPIVKIASVLRWTWAKNISLKQDSRLHEICYDLEKIPVSLEIGSTVKAISHDTTRCIKMLSWDMFCGVSIMLHSVNGRFR